MIGEKRERDFHCFSSSVVAEKELCRIKSKLYDELRDLCLDIASKCLQKEATSLQEKLAVSREVTESTKTPYTLDTFSNQFDEETRIALVLTDPVTESVAHMGIKWESSDPTRACSFYSESENGNIDILVQWDGNQCMWLLVEQPTAEECRGTRLIDAFDGKLHLECSKEAFIIEMSSDPQGFDTLWAEYCEKFDIIKKETVERFTEKIHGLVDVDIRAYDEIDSHIRDIWSELEEEFDEDFPPYFDWESEEVGMGEARIFIKDDGDVLRSFDIKLCITVQH